MRRFPRVLGVSLLCAGCELQEVTLAEPEPFVVLEMYLVAGDSTAHAALHASAGAEHLLGTIDGLQMAHEGYVSRFVETSLLFPGECLAQGAGSDPEDFPGGFACFETIPDQPIAAGGLYRLDLRLEDGSRLTGATRVPEQVAFSFDAGSDVRCYLEPETQLELSWPRTAGAKSYVLDLEASGVRDALGDSIVDLRIPEPLILRGLAVGDSDTTIVLPAEFGIFDRFSLPAELLVALQRGMPEGIEFNVTIAAIDQNFLDWVRGGDFNPSGLIRTPSLFGDAGTGVLASMSIDRFYGTTGEDAATNQPCGT